MFKPSLPRNVYNGYCMALSVFVLPFIYLTIFGLSSPERWACFGLLATGAVVSMMLARRYSLQNRQLHLLAQLEPALVALYKEVRHPEASTLDAYLEWRAHYLGLHTVQVVLDQAKEGRLPELVSTSMSSDAYSRVANVLNEVRKSVR